MHAILTHINPLTAYDLLSSEEKCISFLQDTELIPKQERIPCKCGSLLAISKDKNRKLGWRWRCKNCRFNLEPLSNSFFCRSKLLINEILAIIFYFVWDIPVMECVKILSEWRQGRGEKNLDTKTVIDIYYACREVCNMYVSHNYPQTTDHQEGELAAKNNILSNINSLESENRSCKKNKTSRQNDKVLQKSDKFYRKCRLQAKLSYGQQIENFLQDVKAVYPGPGIIGKCLLEVEVPFESKEIDEIVQPSPKRSKIEAVKEDT